jgi:hypothetical protein
MLELAMAAARGDERPTIVVLHDACGTSVSTALSGDKAPQS